MDGGLCGGLPDTEKGHLNSSGDSQKAACRRCRVESGKKRNGAINKSETMAIFIGFVRLSLLK